MTQHSGPLIAPHVVDAYVRRFPQLKSLADALSTDAQTRSVAARAFARNACKLEELEDTPDGVTPGEQAHLADVASGRAWQG